MEKLNIKAVSISLGVFLAIIYVICVLFDIILPTYEMHSAWQLYLPGFTWLTPFGFLLGFLESFLWGFLSGILFVPIYNYSNDIFKNKK